MSGRHDESARRVLLTGSDGRIGQVVGQQLESRGWRVRDFDLAGGKDLLNEKAVRKAARGCSAIVHSGAISHDNLATPAQIIETNVLGTWHVLLAAEHSEASRVVHFSSVQVFGVSEGEGTPDYLPVDDDHPLRASRPYGMSKLLTEEMCESWTRRTGITTVVLRPVMVLDDDMLGFWKAEKAEYGAFVHVDDVADAVERGLTSDIQGHVRLTLCGPGGFDTARARSLLGWQPTRDWA